MPTYQTTRPNGRLTKTEKQVGRFKVQTFREFGWIGYRVIGPDGRQVEAVLEGDDPDFDKAVEIGRGLSHRETLMVIRGWSEKPARQSEESKESA